ncbi:MAG: PDZ domain-containing protein, partial [Planctomycetales bacterium]|nr:PDZ domain-containing protein [Planctomycetales bacterium]
AGNAAGNLSTQAGQNAANIGANVGANVDASVNRPSLGVNVRELADGVSITGITQGGVGQIGGIRIGDTIRSLNGTQITSHQQLISQIQSAAQLGRPVNLQVLRNGQLQNLQLSFPQVSQAGQQVTSGFRGINAGNLSGTFDRFQADFRGIETPSIPVNLRNDFNRLNQQVAQLGNSVRGVGQNVDANAVRTQVESLRNEFNRLAGQIQDQDVRDQLEDLRDQLNDFELDDAAGNIRSGSVAPDAQGAVNSTLNNSTSGSVEATRNSASGTVNSATGSANSATGGVTAPATNP